jgi:cyanate lyase
MKSNLEQLEEMQKELFKRQCDLDIQKAMVKHFIKKKQAKQLTLTDVSQHRELLEAYTQFLWTQHNNLSNAENNEIALNKFIASNFG